MNLYGKPYNSATASTDKGVPLNLKVDLEATLKPSSVQEVYNHIESDLAQATKLMKMDQQLAGLNYRFSNAALNALEARIALYKNEWQKAIDFSDSTLKIKGDLVNLNTTKQVPNHYTSAESILALDNTLNAAVQYMAYVSPELLSSYDTQNDLRFPLYFEKSGSKYKVIKGGNSEFKTSFRVAELYFIKAESYLKLNKLDQAKATLFSVLQNRYTATGFAKLQTEISAMNSTELMKFILDERFREFALEGQRWYDLRRANQKQIIHLISGKEYILQENDVRYIIEIPQAAKLNNPHL